MRAIWRVVGLLLLVSPAHAQGGASKATVAYHPSAANPYSISKTWSLKNGVTITHVITPANGRLNPPGRDIYIRGKGGNQVALLKNDAARFRAVTHRWEDKGVSYTAQIRRLANGSRTYLLMAKSGFDIFHFDTGDAPGLKNDPLSGSNLKIFNEMQAGTGRFAKFQKALALQ